MVKSVKGSLSNGYALPKGFTVGADPEMFIKDASGKHVSAYGLIPGTKVEPHPVEGGAIQVDGMAAEINISPAKTFEEFNNNIISVMKALKSNLPKDYTLDIVPSVVFDEDVFEEAPEEAKELGCSPDFNAWTQELNMPPECEDNPRLRCAGGHLHFGWTEGEDLGDIQHLLNCSDLVRQLDWYLAAWSLSKDSDKLRRELYGKAGACRVKSYGVEYRTLSNFWLVSKQLRLDAWNRSVLAISEMNNRYMPERNPDYCPMLIEAINTSTRNAALESIFSYPILSTSRW
jgi:hypothetical protein